MHWFHVIDTRHHEFEWSFDDVSGRGFFMNMCGLDDGKNCGMPAKHGEKLFRPSQV
jgi:hypothetical protein